MPALRRDAIKFPKRKKRVGECHSPTLFFHPTLLLHASVNGTNIGTGPAGNAFRRVYYIDWVALGNAICWTFAYTYAASYASVCNFVSHSDHLREIM